jgi:hypothetical protein
VRKKGRIHKIKWRINRRKADSREMVERVIKQNEREDRKQKKDNYFKEL